jgi:hypothetical protein
MEMRSSSVLLTVAALLAVATLVASGRASADPVGFVAASQGVVEFQAVGGSTWEAAAVDRDIEIGDSIRTGPGAALKIVLSDETILSVGESTDLVIDSFLVGSAATKDPSVLKLLKGRARVLVGEAFGGPTRVEMHTPTAVIGVKGTEFEAYVIEDPYTGMWTLVCGLDGHIFVRQLDPAKGRVVEPRPGLCTRVVRDQEPGDEIPRPNGFPPVPTPSTQPIAAEAVLFGPPGVSAGQPTTGQSLDQFVVKDASIRVTGSFEEVQGIEGRDDYFEDIVQTRGEELKKAGESLGVGTPQP